MSQTTTDHSELMQQSFYQAVEDYTKACARNTHVAHIINEGLNVFAGLPYSHFASLFMMNDDTFEFDHSATRPKELQNEAQQKFAGLLCNGAVGTALSEGHLISSRLEDGDEQSFMLVPMLGARGVLGLLLVSSSTDSQLLSPMMQKKYGYFTQMFSHMLENSMFLETNRRLDDILRQQIASRTIKLVETTKQLQDRMEDLKTNINMSIPHEVRTPINTILGFTGYMLNHFSEIDVQEASEMLHDIQDAGRRLNRLFENYLYYSRLAITATNQAELSALLAQSTGQIKLMIENIASYRCEAAGRHNDLLLDIKDCEIAMAEQHFQKLIEELVDNALKYSPLGSTVTLRAYPSSRYYHLEVNDRGRGMTPEQIESIQAYAQFERAVHEQQGMGLGLAIVQKIADIYNCKLHFDSQPEQGTRVTLDVPRAINCVA